MALQNNILVGPNPDINYTEYSGAGAQTIKFTVKLADLVALGAFTSGDVILINLPARAFVIRSFVKHSTSVAGPSISACTAQLQTATGNRGASLDVFAAVSNTAYDLFLNVTATAKEASIGAASPLYLHVVATGANLSVATAGQIDVVVTFDVLP